MKLTFLGAAHEVTGSCTLIEAAGKRILVDCGMEQGPDLYENAPLPIAAGEINCVLLTHAHIDHSGKLPVLVKNGFSGPIYTTLATGRLSRIMLSDSAHIQQSEAVWRNRKAARSGEPPYVPLYTVSDVEATCEQFSLHGYGEKIALSKDITAEFTDSGHLLGSASVLLTVQENGRNESIVFSGDIGNTDRPIIRDPISPFGADFAVIESTYGTRLHKKRPDYLLELTALCERTFARGGNVVIPCFAVGRTQEMLVLFRQIKGKGLISSLPDFPVYVDSPLANEATRIYHDRELLDYYDEATREQVEKGVNILSFPGLQAAVTTDESIAINRDPRPKVILSASGMCEAGRIRHHLKHNLWRRECTVLFVGYQAEGTLGRKLINGASSTTLFGEEVQVNAEIVSLNGISGHADRDGLLAWLDGFQKKPKQVFVNHGTDRVCDEFAETISVQLGIPAVAPYNGSSYTTDPFACVDSGNQKLLEKPVSYPKGGRQRSLFEALTAAGHRLMRIIDQQKETTNKNIATLTSQITALCDKWEKR